MSEYVTDPELLAQLNGATKEEKPEYVEDAQVLAELNKGQGEGYVDDPELLKQLNAASKGPVKPEGPGIAGAIAPSVIGYGYSSPTGFKELGQAVKAGASPYVSAAGEGLKKTMDIYKARPVIAPLVDLAGVATVGVPPIAAGQQVMGAWDKLNAAKEGAMGVSQELSKGEQTREAYNAMKRALYKNDPTGFRNVISSTYGAPAGTAGNVGPGNNAVRAMLSSAEGKAAMAANPEFAQAAQAYLKTVPTYGEQVGKVVSPFLKGAARVAGPIGMAANLYEASPYLAEAGPELSSGRAQNRIAEAQRMMLSRPTPAPLTPMEASNLLQSDDARTINIYGGRANLEALVKSGLRQKAASKVLGPVAPGQ